MLTDELNVGKEYELVVKSKAKGVNNNLKVTVEVYYGEKRTRYYYEKPGKTYTIDISDSAYYVAFSKIINLKKPLIL